MAFVVHEEGAENRWSEIPQAEALVELLGHTITTRTRPDDTFDAALGVVRSCRAISGVRGEAPVAIASVIGLLAESTP